MNPFAEMVKKRRAHMRLGLRELCEKCGLDPSNWSKVERGIASPPKDLSIIDKIRRALDYAKNTTEAIALRDNAFIARHEIPADIIKDKQLVAKLPIFFRSVRGDKHTPGELRKLAELIRDSETAE